MVQYEDLVDPVDGTRWRVDKDFINSNWTCIWDAGCAGIHDEPTVDLQQGCCSAGAHLLDDDEAMMIAAVAATMDPVHFQHAAVAEEEGVFVDDRRHATRVVDGACIFLNRPGFAGGVGCALHLEALSTGDDPMDFKPSICWQAPIKVDHHDDGSKTLRPWSRDDWGPDGQKMAYCCTERQADRPAQSTDDLASAFVGEVSVAISLHHELRGVLGPELAERLRADAQASAEQTIPNEPAPCDQDK